MFTMEKLPSQPGGVWVARTAAIILVADYFP